MRGEQKVKISKGLSLSSSSWMEQAAFFLPGLRVDQEQVYWAALLRLR